METRCRIAQQAAFQPLLSALLLPAVLGVPVTIELVPSVKDVPPQDLTRLQKCLSSCAVNTNNLVTAFDTNLTGFVVDPLLPSSKVTKGSFTRLRYWTVDGAIYAQPLYVPDVVVNGSIMNLVFVATEHSSVYALNSGDSPIHPTDFDPPCYDIAPEWGITSTPYIDPKSQTIYVVPWTKEDGKFVYRIHALDLATGKEKLGGPSSPISATKTFADGSFVRFDAKQQVQRPGLGIFNGRLYVMFGSRCDASVYYGWVLAFDANTLLPREVFSMPYTDPGNGPGIWQGGAGPVFFNGSMYVVIGNGAFDAARGSWGDSAVRMTLPDLKVVDHFTPSNEEILDDDDLDFGSAALIPVNGKYMFTGGKEGSYYLLKAYAMGSFNRNNKDGNAFQAIPSATSTGNASVSIGTGGIYSGAAYWPAGNALYLHGVRTVPLQKYEFMDDDKLRLVASSAIAGNFSKRASVPIVSAVSQNATEAIVWEVDANDTLYAWNATSLAPLWNSSAPADLADCKGWVKFATPSVAGGKVFVGCGSKLVAYGPK
ncbi:g6021 [Coccomyxa elongata]